MSYESDLQEKIFEFCYMNALRDATLQGAFLGRTEDILKEKKGSKKAEKTKELL